MELIKGQSNQIINHQSSTIKNQSSKINHQASTIKNQASTHQTSNIKNP
jgi:hypothetical protein